MENTKDGFKKILWNSSCAAIMCLKIEEDSSTNQITISSNRGSLEIEKEEFEAMKQAIKKGKL